MEQQELKYEVSLTYRDLTKYLKSKYGLPPKPYFEIRIRKGEEKLYKNMVANSRTSEGLNIHHDFENVYERISDADNAKSVPYYVQLPENLTYCNLLEHLILHYKIITEKYEFVCREVYCNWDKYRSNKLNEISEKYSAEIADYQKRGRNGIFIKQCWQSELEHFPKDKDTYLQERFNVKKLLFNNGMQYIINDLALVYLKRYYRKNGENLLFPIEKNFWDFVDLVRAYILFVDSIQSLNASRFEVINGTDIRHVYKDIKGYKLIDYNEKNPFDLAYIKKENEIKKVPLYKLCSCYHKFDDIPLHIYKDKITDLSGSEILIPVCSYSYSFEKFRYCVAKESEDLYLQLNLMKIFEKKY
ncbi:MAG: hypothetical protein E7309_13360 [Butyrivibrio sp.]|jgi:hypothetical protein|nr:hypothetical protein [Butyrivibrio sp.]